MVARIQNCLQMLPLTLLTQSGGSSELRLRHDGLHTLASCAGHCCSGIWATPTDKQLPTPLQPRRMYGYQSLRGTSLQAATMCMSELVRLHLMQSALTQCLMVDSVLHTHAGKALTEGPFRPVASLASQVPNQCLARGLSDALAHPARALTPSQRGAASRGRVWLQSAGTLLKAPWLGAPGLHLPGNWMDRPSHAVCMDTMSGHQRAQASCRHGGCQAPAWLPNAPAELQHTTHLSNTLPAVTQ